jgi:hypothetical protein
MLRPCGFPLSYFASIAAIDGGSVAPPERNRQFGDMSARGIV